MLESLNAIRHRLFDPIEDPDRFRIGTFTGTDMLKASRTNLPDGNGCTVVEVLNDKNEIPHICGWADDILYIYSSTGWLPATDFDVEAVGPDI